jgi:hypothetical protein
MNQFLSYEITPLHIKYKYVTTPVAISYRLLNCAAENLVLQTEYFGPFFTFFLPCPYTINQYGYRQQYYNFKEPVSPQLRQP